MVGTKGFKNKNSVINFVCVNCFNVKTVSAIWLTYLIYVNVNVLKVIEFHMSKLYKVN